MSNIAVCVQDDNKNVSPKETIDSIYKAGFKDVFVQYYHRENLKFDEIEQIDYCKKLGLNIVFCHLGYKDINEIWIEGEFGEKITEEYIADLNLMHQKNIDMVCMHLCTHKESPMYNEIGLERIKRIVEYAKKIGIKIAFENTRKKGYLEYVLGNINVENIGLCLDIGHYHVYFDDELNWEFFKDRIFAVHLHDNDKTLDQHLFPGEGTVDWNDALYKLKKYGYNGPMTLELCYRDDYLKMTLDEFYKKGYEIGVWLDEIRREYGKF